MIASAHTRESPLRFAYRDGVTVDAVRHHPAGAMPLSPRRGLPQVGREPACVSARRPRSHRIQARIEQALHPFVYMPPMHSEALPDQDGCIDRTQQFGADSLEFTELYRDIIRRFGRVPHRNRMLGRSTTP